MGNTLESKSKTIPLKAVSPSLSDVAKIYSCLKALVMEQARKEIAGLVRPADKTEEQWATECTQLKESAFRVTVTIAGADGSSLYDDDVKVFSSANLPHRIASIYITNITAYRAVSNTRPAHSFELFLDFRKPPLVDGENPISGTTPNESALAVEGWGGGWVASVTSTVMDVLNNTRNHNQFIHRAFVYDAGLLFFGLPLSLFVAWLLSPVIRSVNVLNPEFLSAAFYVYVVLLVVWIYRIGFGYTRWAFPLVELRDQNEQTAGHRSFWYLIVVGLIISGIWALISSFMSDFSATP